MQHICDRLSSSSIAAEFKAFIENPEFPCVGAKAALRRHQMEILVAGDIRCPADDEMITERLQWFAIRQDTERDMFVSQVVVFPGRAPLTETDFETWMWQRLTALHMIDRRDFRWDPAVDSDPDSPHFSLSIGGKAFFVVGLHPAASRFARRFRHPALVFNLHAQFERLRREGRYETIRGKIIERDVALQGAPNPMLFRHGEASAARQFSGRIVDENWRCPFGHG
jgi:FPC/CPF motif-containing protein YcgG